MQAGFSPDRFLGQEAAVTTLRPRARTHQSHTVAGPEHRQDDLDRLDVEDLDPVAFVQDVPQVAKVEVPQADRLDRGAACGVGRQDRSPRRSPG